MSVTGFPYLESRMRLFRARARGYISNDLMAPGIRLKRKRHKQYMIPVRAAPLPASGCNRLSRIRQDAEAVPPVSPCQRRGRLSCTAACDCRRRKKSPRLRTSVRHVYARSRTGILSPESNISQSLAESMRKNIRNVFFSGENAFFPDMYKFAVQVLPTEPDISMRKVVSVAPVRTQRYRDEKSGSSFPRGRLAMRQSFRSPRAFPVSSTNSCFFEDICVFFRFRI